MSEKPSSLKSPVPIAFQAGPGLGLTGPPPMSLFPFISQIETWPVLVFWKRMSEKPASLKSPAPIVGDEAGLGIFAVGAVEADERLGRAVAGRGPDDLEYRSVLVDAPAGGRPEQVAVGVGDEAGLGIGAVGAGEAPKRGRPARIAGRGFGHLQHCPVAVSAALKGRPEQVAVGVGDEAGLRTCALVVVEADQRGGLVCIAGRGLGDLEHRAVAISA